MGSPTLEILRQGFWASLTGGWFFDPHQEMFCNTFHMYLWLFLLLFPLSLYMTTDVTHLTLGCYTAVIFVLFSITKYVNHKFHVMFDGEEIQPDDTIEKGEETETEPQAGPSNASPKTDVDGIELEVLRECGENCSDDENANENSSLALKMGNKKADVPEQPMPKPDVDEPNGGEGSGVVFVDIHKDNGSVSSRSSPNISLSQQTRPKVSAPQDKEGVSAVIENKQASQQLDDQPSNYSNSSSGHFPFNLLRLLDSSSDSSWSSGTFTGSNNLNDNNNQDATYIPPSPLCANHPLSESMGIKSENTLSTSSKQGNALSDDNQNKAVSLSVLESKGADAKNKKASMYRTGQMSNCNAGVWFSLPEMEKSPEGSKASDDNESTDRLTASDIRFKEDCKDDDDDDDDEGGKGADAIVCESPTADGSGTGSAEVEMLTFGSVRPMHQLRRRHAVRSGSYATNDAQVKVCHRVQIDRLIDQPKSEENPATQETEELTQQQIDNAKHVALSHEDTSPGAVHCFQDENGQWQTYMFADEGVSGPVPVSSGTGVSPAVMNEVGTSSILRDLLRTSRRGRESTSTSASMMDYDVEYDSLFPVPPAPITYNRLDSWTQAYSLQAKPTSVKVEVKEPPVRHFYNLPLFASFSVKVEFDRLALLALLDRSKSVFDSIISVLLATAVAGLGFSLLYRGYFVDFWIIAACFVIAKCHFSLLKSVQPDSASPVHGHNCIIVFSRAVYFCLVAVLIIVCDELGNLEPSSNPVYGLHLCTRDSLHFARDAFITFLLAFPAIFLFGLLPQINTFTMYILEQADIHIFGGTAMTSLWGSFYAIFRSLISVAFLYGFCYGALLHEAKGQNVIFSVFCALLVAVSYHLSRSTSDPNQLWLIVKEKVFGVVISDKDGEIQDPLPSKLNSCVKNRLFNDLITCINIVVVVFAIHVSTAFTALQPTLSYILYILTGMVGIITHYILPQLRKQLPWLFVSSPMLKSAEYYLFEARGPARLMMFERAYVILIGLERNILYPLTFISALTRYSAPLTEKFGPTLGPFIVTLTGLKLLRGSFCQTPRQHIVLIWTVLFFQFDYKNLSETFPIDYFVMSVFVDKAIDLLLKFRFIFTYTAPWQITWGSAFHAFAQPFSVPHCGMLFLQAIVSAILSAPLNPFLGSAIFITSYVRPIKFWEKNYNTKRVDHSNTRLSTHLDSNPGSDDNNLNSIFYEHLTRSLQHSLCGDLSLGRWGSVSSGDCFVLASDYLNALVHIIEVGNGFMTFQLRGLEFRGTYCQQREVEAITESVQDDTGCCCFNPGHLPHLLSLNASFGQRWLAWEVTQKNYILEGYSVTDNTATSMFQVFDLRKIFITYYVKTIIFYAVRSSKLVEWISDDNLMGQLSELKKERFVDLDSAFRPMTDVDFDVRQGGVSLPLFCVIYHEWIAFCNSKRPEPIEDESWKSNLITLCFALSLLGRRLLSTASFQQTATLKSFLHGLHALFKGDFRVTSLKDEWVFAEPDMELLRKVVAPAVRMSVKLHQDHFTCPDEYDDNAVLFDAISSHEESLVISHEGHPIWRQAVLHNKPSLLALRYVIDEGTDDYKIIMLMKRHLSFRVIKVNKECVRGLWAGQLQELVFLRNRNPERGSIQNAKQALRNMINSSCDQPIGYPIYVSPLTTSFSDTNTQYSSILGNVVKVQAALGRLIRSCFTRIRARYAGSCHSGGVTTHATDANEPYSIPMASFDAADKQQPECSKPIKIPTVTPRGSVFRATYSAVPNAQQSPTSSPPLEAFTLGIGIQFARLNDVTAILSDLNTDDTVEWPSNELKVLSGRSAWGDWRPQIGQVGTVIHMWDNYDSITIQRSHIDHPIVLLKIDDNHVPVLQSGLEMINEIKV